jgi:ribosomal protein L35
MRSAKAKLKLKYPNKNYKMKTKKGLTKRIIIVGGLYNKGFKFKAPGRVHKMANKSHNNLKRKKQPRYVGKTDIRHILRQLPYFRRKKYKR